MAGMAIMAMVAVMDPAGRWRETTSTTGHVGQGGANGRAAAEFGGR